MACYVDVVDVVDAIQVVDKVDVSVICVISAKKCRAGQIIASERVRPYT